MMRGDAKSGSLAVVALVLCVMICGTPARSTMVLTPGDPAPMLWGSDLEGERVNVQFGETKATLVNFWATWCEPCKLEMPAIQELLERRGEENVRIYGVLVGQHDPKDVQAYLDEAGITYPVFSAPVNVLKTWNALVFVPTTYLIREDGTIARRYVGATPESIAALVRDVENILDGKPMGTMPKMPPQQVTTPPES